MMYGVQFTDNGSISRLKRFTQRIAKNTPANTKRDAKKMARIYGRNVYKSMKIAGVQEFPSNTTNLAESLLAEPTIQGNNAVLTVPSYMYPLSRMKGHYVITSPENDPIKQWANFHGMTKAWKIWVEGKHFLSSGERNARKEISAKVAKGELHTIKEMEK